MIWALRDVSLALENFDVSGPPASCGTPCRKLLRPCTPLGSGSVDSLVLLSASSLAWVLCTEDARQNCALIVSGGPASVDEALDGDQVEEEAPWLDLKDELVQHCRWFPQFRT